MFSSVLQVTVAVPSGNGRAVTFAITGATVSAACGGQRGETRVLRRS